MIKKEKREHPRYRSKIIILFLGILFLLALFHQPLLNGLANQLVYKDALKPADAIVVLAGDHTGERLMAGISLFKKGYGRKIVFWGGPVYWKITNGELFLRQLKESGIGPEFALWSGERLIENSTWGEAQVNIALLKKMDAESFILVTSDYHTARARYVYARLARENNMAIYVCPVQDSTVRLRGWWKDRESAKTVLGEIERTVWYKLFQ